MSAENLVLYHVAPTRSSRVHWMLEELAQPYTLKVLDRKKGENQTPEYLKLNPAGKVPTLVHNGVAITEASAICCYLADAFPEAGLNIPLNNKLRGIYLQWLFYGPSCIEPVIIDQRFPRAEIKDVAPEMVRGMLGWGNLETVLKVLTLSLTNKEYIVGDKFTAADVIIGGGIRWGMFTKVFPEIPEFKSYIERLSARPAYQRANQKDRELSQAQTK